MNRRSVVVTVAILAVVLAAAVLAILLLVVAPRAADAVAYQRAMARADDETLVWEARIEAVTGYAENGRNEARRAAAAFTAIGLTMRAFLARFEEHGTILARAREALLKGETEAVRLALARAAELARLAEIDEEDRGDERDLEARLAWPERRRVRIVPDDHATVAEAMAAAGIGDIVHVKKGVHEGPVALSKGVLLEGEDAEGTVIRCAPDAGSVIRAEDGFGAIRSLTVEHTGEWPEKLEVAGVNLVRSRVDLRHVTVRKACGHGLIVEGPCAPTIEDCRFEENKQAGILVWRPGAEPVIRGCRSTKNKYSGIAFATGAGGSAESCVVEDNGWSGIAVTGEGSRAVLRDNTCRRNVVDGIHVNDKGFAEATGNRCEENRRQGFFFGDAGQGVATGNTCSGNTYNGIRAGEGASVEAIGNTCESNGYSGISLRGAGTEGTIRENRCLENTYHGISVEDGPRAEIASNLCRSNRDAGIATFGPDANSRAEANDCVGNESHGIYFGKGATGAAIGNRCDLNDSCGIGVSDAGTVVDLEGNDCRRSTKDGISVFMGAGGRLTGNRCESNGGAGIRLGADCEAVLGENTSSGNKDGEIVDRRKE